MPTLTRSLVLAVSVLVACGPGEDLGEPRHGTFRLLGELVELDYALVGGQVVVGDDMVLSPDDEVFPSEQAAGRQEQALFKQGSSTSSFLWPNGIVPYTIHSSVTTPARVRDAIAEWQNKTVIQFVPRTNQTTYVTFTELAGNTVCKAQVGYATGQRFVYLRDTSVSTACITSVITHEIGHTVGFIHEQQRPERDTYVRINSACVPTGSNAFTILSSGVLKIGPYDIASTMHYRSTTLNKSGCGGYSIYRKDGALLLHDWTTLSAGDISGVAAMYGSTDPDNDGVTGTSDNCPTVANGSQLDTDADGKGDACDSDDDNDTVADTADNCPIVPNSSQLDTDADGKGDLCDADLDGDGVPNTTDNCRAVKNANQLDTDGDGKGDACETDADGDGVLNASDNCPVDANPEQADLDGDKAGDACDPDADGDGVADSADNCPRLANASQLDVNSDGVGDACQQDGDADGVPDVADNCPSIPNPDQTDSSGGGSGDACRDSDSDSVPDVLDNCPGVANPQQEDGDQDGLGDRCDPAPGSEQGTEGEELPDAGTQPAGPATAVPTGPATPAPGIRGGCSAFPAGASALPLLLFLGLAARRRRLSYLPDAGKYPAR